MTETLPRDIIRSLPKPARDRLKRHVCGLCEIRLHRGYCSAIGDRCSRETMLTRAARCLDAGRVGVSKEAAATLFVEAKR